MPARPRPQAERFWEKVNKTDTCWLWSAAVLDQTGYGYFSVNGRGMVGAHKVSWEMANGVVPEGLEVDHRCHVKTCVRPRHLRLKTHAENGAYRKGAQSNSSTGIRGVFWSAQKGRWQVKVNKLRKQYHGGYFDDVEQAEEEAMNLRKKLFGEGDFDATICR